MVVGGDSENGLPSPTANFVYSYPMLMGGLPHLCMFKMISTSWGSF